MAISTAEIQAWLAANPNATDFQRRQVMDQFGISPEAVAQAAGLDNATVAARYAAAAPAPVPSAAPALAPQQIAEARDWITSQWGIPQGVAQEDVNNGLYTNAFGANGVYDYSDSQRNNAVLGAGQAMGYGNDQMSQILGLPSADIGSYAQANQGSIDSGAGLFRHDMQASASPDIYGSPAAPTTQGGQAGGITSQQINGWLSANPGANDGQIRSAMDQYGVSPLQMSDATGVGLNDVWSRYAAVGGGQAGGGGQGNAPSAPGVGGGQSPPHGPPGMSAMPNWGNYGNQSNQYQGALDSAISQQFTDTLTKQWLPAIRSNAIGVGGLGGSRQGVAEGEAIGQAGKGLASALTQSHYGDWTAGENRGLQRYQGDQNAFLGNQGQQLGFYTQQRGQDQSGAALGASLLNMGNQGEWNGLQNASGIYGGYSGLGGQTTQSGQQGGGAMGALGGLLGGAQLGNNMGWWGGGRSGGGGNSTITGAGSPWDYTGQYWY